MRSEKVKARAVRCTGFLCGGAFARGRSGNLGQNESKRVGQLPIGAFNERMERPWRPDEESVRAGSKSLRFELRIGRRSSCESVRDCYWHRNGRVGCVPFLDVRNSWHQADVGSNK